ncbi:Phosphopantothenoylcysteine decarboxylase / Phosphopantothenoylcysteine synthetase [Thioalkalivibrio nitratireducens DSM 14787]|uniref:Coenzyme A biosynthesis bifunctional protein CoaBC n=1 Tax=Thioalkalivibrio nitratireducens (strain DSM 14787 / UNIQEM 213 / ALEN2) TaxID=1255043 RepID=L0DUS0_THIND|nr:bifunctional phosphopantothenoylcysteine decarboxylase/phosphopantothenate--cysteine ligase CoaBC [Thioalkalivibrio nitratireducens]AGA32101.1 Phosphopantothenoylcysteine decarboxylase / Phosphopantothenoylcysteine synthetase [Thioalkalivibrio nitratireducens DSM 14787]
MANGQTLKILLGVGGGIAAYKACELVRRLRDANCEVRVVMTRAASAFVSPLSFQALSGLPVRSDLLDAEAESGMDHIALARWADRVVIAPATADLMARMATGLADDLLTTLCLATEAPILLAPAMNRVMWAHPATQANHRLLVTRGVRTVGPEHGDQACGEHGAGRMAEPAAILQALLDPPPGPLSGKQVLITAGPTHEAIDPVRFIGNRSSGRMGVALAAAARDAGARICLVHGPLAVPVPPGVKAVAVDCAASMRTAVFEHLEGVDLFIAAAAVADYRPREPASRKLKKDTQTLTLDLVRNPDILAEVAAHRPRPFVVGFAAETHDLHRHARAKLERKGLDMIAANDVSAGRAIGTPDNALTVFWPGGERGFAAQPKETLAPALIRLIAERMAEAPVTTPSS